jgi:hypothetical protein
MGQQQDFLTAQPFMFVRVWAFMGFNLLFDFLEIFEYILAQSLVSAPLFGEEE